MEYRIGQGYDVHAIAEGLPMWLGGVQIPSERGFVAHSDGDVAIHALCDALLGALALGDIGHLFPDTDPEWEGADSVRLLEAVVALLRGKGWRVVNADVTILAEAPKIAPRVAEMRARLAAPLGVPVDAVSVKATTMEKLGPVGAREGIAAQAVALIESVS
jgi:2-C-methyl-D-erythritol 2,4-cyclodiphosphate synthase